MGKYIPEIHENWNQLTVESAKLILEQSEKRTNEYISAADDLTKRSLAIIQFTAPIIIASLAYNGRLELGHFTFQSVS